ncbi:hypothetical protein [Frankia sp. AvcI1]|uniref:hypothetical protein n=1 Tax=Frankia sp. AvcI1 TaxID=573496 RepID=UPI002117BD58|nr:hypothetical protein [Frankia sp. AvcI1]
MSKHCDHETTSGALRAASRIAVAPTEYTLDGEPQPAGLITLYTAVCAHCDRRLFQTHRTVYAARPGGPAIHRGPWFTDAPDPGRRLSAVPAVAAG